VVDVEAERRRNVVRASDRKDGRRPPAPGQPLEDLLHGSITSGGKDEIGVVIEGGLPLVLFHGLRFDLMPFRLEPRHELLDVGAVVAGRGVECQEHAHFVNVPIRATKGRRASNANPHLE
jgi:hypothetical protein